MKQTLLSQKSILKICIALLTTAIICFLSIALTKAVCPDEREHLYATFATYSGKIPYRDFFEHHHPLLWYIGSLFLYINDNTPYIWYTLRIFMVIVTLTTSFFIYKISKIQQLSTPLSIIGATIYLSLYEVKYSGLEYRPDNLMMLFFTSGLYFLLSYFKKTKPYLLNISIILFFLSFLSLQKSILILAPIFFIFILPNLNNKTFFKDFLRSLITPLILLASLILALYKTNSLTDYIELNWLINLHINLPENFSAHSIKYTLIETFVCLLIALYLFIKNKQHHQFLANYLFTVSIMVIMYFKCNMPIYEQYFLTLSPYNAIILALIINRFNTSPLFCNLTTIALSIIILISSISTAQYYKKQTINLQTHINLDKIIYTYSNKNDSVVCAIELSTVGGLRHCAQGYYFFSLGSLAPIHSFYFHGRELPRLNNVIQTRLPKIVVNSSWADCKLNNHNNKIECGNQEIDVAKMEKHYTNNGFIYLRKY